MLFSVSRDVLRFSGKLLLFAQPLPRDGGMAEDHKTPEAGQLPKVWTRESPKNERRQESVAGQCRMR